MSKIKDHYFDEIANSNGDFYDQQMDMLFWGTKKKKTMAESLNNESEKDELVDTNLKTAAAAGKPRLSDVPPVALLALGAAMSNGKDKYGRFNWRETGSTASVFYDAMQRHLLDWFNGEDFASDSNVHHLGHIMASCAILLDSKLHNKLNDDRGSHGSIVYNPDAWFKKS